MTNFSNFTSGAYSDFNKSNPSLGQGWGAKLIEGYESIPGTYTITPYGGINIDLFDHLKTSEKVNLKFQKVTNEIEAYEAYFEMNIVSTSLIQIVSKTGKLMEDKLSERNFILEYNYINAETNEVLGIIILEVNYVKMIRPFSIENKRITFVGGCPGELLVRPFISDLVYGDTNFNIVLTRITGATLVGSMLDFYTSGSDLLILPIDQNSTNNEIVLEYEFIKDEMSFTGFIILNKYIPVNSELYLNSDSIAIDLNNGQTKIVDTYNYLFGTNRDNISFRMAGNWTRMTLFNRLIKMRLSGDGSSFSLSSDETELAKFLQELNAQKITIPDYIEFFNIIIIESPVGTITTDIKIKLIINSSGTIPSSYQFYYNNKYNTNLNFADIYPADKYYSVIESTSIPSTYDLQISRNSVNGDCILYTTTPNIDLVGNHNIKLKFTDVVTLEDSYLTIELVQRVTTIIDQMALASGTLNIGRYTPGLLNFYSLLTGLDNYSDITFKYVISPNVSPQVITKTEFNSFIVSENESIPKNTKLYLTAYDNRRYTSNQNKDSLGNIIGLRESIININIISDDTYDKTSFLSKNCDFYLNPFDINNEGNIVVQFTKANLAELIRPIDPKELFINDVFTIDTVNSVLPEVYELDITGSILSGSMTFNYDLVKTKNYKMILKFTHPLDTSGEVYTSIINFKYKGQ